MRAKRSVREKARWLRCDGDGGSGFGTSREIGERESEVAQSWLGVAGGGSRWLAGWLGTVRKRAESKV